MWVKPSRLAIAECSGVIASCAGVITSCMGVIVCCAAVIACYAAVIASYAGVIVCCAAVIAYRPWCPGSAWVSPEAALPPEEAEPQQGIPRQEPGHEEIGVINGCAAVIACYTGVIAYRAGVYLLGDRDCLMGDRL